MEQGRGEIAELLKKLEREYYEKCDGQGHDFSPFMQGYCKWLCWQMEQLEKKLGKR